MNANYQIRSSPRKGSIDVKSETVVVMDRLQLFVLGVGVLPSRIRVTEIRVTINDILLVSTVLDVGNSILAIENLCELFKRNTLGLDKEEVDEDEFEEDPNSVEGCKIPWLWETIPSYRIGLASDSVSNVNIGKSDGDSLLSKGQDSLDC